MRTPTRTLDGWNRLAERRLTAILQSARKAAALKKRGPRLEWKVGLRLVGNPEIKRLNAHFRGKNRVTDVLSFPAPEPFRSAGHLGELILSLPVLKRQAREQGHKPETELQVLLVHGVLHLLGFDHEKSRKQAAEMARWEARLLQATQGLIDRNH
jgi:rRNA maturation RNase YbeY